MKYYLVCGCCACGLSCKLNNMLRNYLFYKVSVFASSLLRMREICVEQWRSAMSHPLDIKVTGNCSKNALRIWMCLPFPSCSIQYSFNIFIFDTNEFFFTYFSQIFPWIWRQKPQWGWDGGRPRQSANTRFLHLGDIIGMELVGEEGGETTVKSVDTWNHCWN